MAHFWLVVVMSYNDVGHNFLCTCSLFTIQALCLNWIKGDKWKKSRFFQFFFHSLDTCEGDHYFYTQHIQTGGEKAKGSTTIISSTCWCRDGRWDCKFISFVKSFAQLTYYTCVYLFSKGCFLKSIFLSWLRLIQLVRCAALKVKADLNLIRSECYVKRIRGTVDWCNLVSSVLIFLNIEIKIERFYRLFIWLLYPGNSAFVVQWELLCHHHFLPNKSFCCWIPWWTHKKQPWCAVPEAGFSFSPLFKKPSHYLCVYCCLRTYASNKDQLLHALLSVGLVLLQQLSTVQ